MAFIEDTIASWTPAQLQSFIQNIVSLEPSQIPSALDLNGLSSTEMTAENLTLTSQLSLSKQLRLISDSQGFKKGQGIMADFYGHATPSWQRDSGLAGAYAFQGNIRAQTQDKQNFASGSDVIFTNSRLWANLINIPITDSASGIAYRVIQAEDQGTLNWDHVGWGLFGPLNDGDTVINRVAASQTTSATDTSYFGQTGLKTIPWTVDPSPLQAGWYYLAVLTDWTTMGTVPKLSLIHI